MHRKKIITTKYLAAFLMTLVIFLIGFILGTLISEFKLQKVYDLENDLRIESLGNELLFRLVEKDLCENMNLSTYTLELSKLGNKLTYMESLYSYDTPQIRSLKNYYSLLLVRHWLIAEQLKNECNVSKKTLLYFYTNIGECEDCKYQGIVLTNVHDIFPDFFTYSFEFHTTNAAISFLKEKYEISAERLPSLVYDGEVFYGFQSKNKLQKLLNFTN